MIDIKERHLTMVKKIIQQLIPGIPVWIFGSRVKGTAKPYSDLDLVIVGPQQIPQQLYYQIKDAMEESDLPYRVDVLDWYRISPEFREVIQKNHVVFPD